MALTLKITSYQAQVLGADSSRVFDKSGGSIGRAQGNDWVLPDPERYISGRHMEISSQGDAYYLTDTSTNGVFINQSNTPVGKGNSVLLNDGDQLKFGDYEVAVALSADSSIADTDPFGNWPGQETGEAAAPFIGGIPESFDPFEAEEPTDPGFNLFSDDQETPGGVSGQPAAEPDHVPSFEEAFQPPGAHVEQLPDDWDKTDYSNESAPAQDRSPGQAGIPWGGRPGGTPGAIHGLADSARQQPAPSTPQPPPVPPLQAQPPEPTPAAAPRAPEPVTPVVPQAPSPAPAQPVAGGTPAMELYAAFLQGAGLDPNSAGQVDVNKAMHDYGMLFRAVVQGMMEVLMARTSLKSEFRMPLTTIRPVENNPLKFSPGVDDALYNLFVVKGRGYLDPVDAIEEGFTDIRNHQMAMMAGMQAAFRELLEIFHPDKFEVSEKGGRRVSLVSVSRKSKAWDAFREFYEKTAADPDSSFQNLFGENFAIAYEEQIRRLSTLK